MGQFLRKVGRRLAIVRGFLRWCQASFQDLPQIRQVPSAQLGLGFAAYDRDIGSGQGPVGSRSLRGGSLFPSPYSTLCSGANATAPPGTTFGGFALGISGTYGTSLTLLHCCGRTEQARSDYLFPGASA